MKDKSESRLLAQEAYFLLSILEMYFLLFHAYKIQCTMTEN